MSNGYTFFTLGYNVQTDLMWKNTYKAYEETSTGRHVEGYGFKVWSFLNITISTEWAQAYKFQAMFSLVPFNIVPYHHEFWFVRPISGKSFSMGTRAYHKVELARALATFTENSKIYYGSVENWIDNGWNWTPLGPYYDSKQEVNYEDPYWNFDISTYLSQWGWYSSWSQWYGQAYYFQSTFF